MQANQDEDRMLTETEVTAMVATSPSTLKRWVGKGDFPEPVKLAGDSRYKRWRFSEVQLWIQTRKKQSII